MCLSLLAPIDVSIRCSEFRCSIRPSHSPNKRLIIDSILLNYLMRKTDRNKDIGSEKFVPLRKKLVRYTDTKWTNVVWTKHVKCCYGKIRMKDGPLNIVRGHWIQAQRIIFFVNLAFYVHVSHVRSAPCHLPPLANGNKNWK